MANTKNAHIEWAQFEDGGSDPVSTPESGYAFIYIKSNDLYIKLDNNTVVGPMSGSSGSINDLSDVTITSAAKGSVLVHNGSVWVDLAVGSNNQFLKANSATSTGLEWVDASSIDGNVTDALVFAVLGW